MMDEGRVFELENAAAEVRKGVLRGAVARGAAHIASSLSVVEILCSLYFGGLARVDSSDKESVDRDRVILSKGHGSLALYSTLAHAGYFDKKELDTFARVNTFLGGEPRLGECPGVEASTGSLGHGVSIGAGIALAMKADHIPAHVFVIVGDGECQEGSIWEAAELAPKLGLDNLTVIVDDNGLQKSCRTDEVVGFDRLARIWESFGWYVIEADGHSFASLERAIAEAKGAGLPGAVIAHTVKGKGISIMEGNPAWHYRVPRRRELDAAMRDLRVEVAPC